MRLENISGPDDDPELSRPATMILEVSILIYVYKKENMALLDINKLLK